MHFHIVSLFPEFFTSPLHTALMQKAQERGIVRVSVHNPRDHGHGVHRAVDDRPYGGGPGMVLMLEPLVKTLRDISQAEHDEYVKKNEQHKQDRQDRRRGRILVMSPAGTPFTQSMAQELAQDESCTLVCGRYEGFDARLEHILPVEYVSMGDAVLNGGEVPALAIMEAVARLVPGFMGKEASGTEESFSSGLLEYPHYTRPETFEGHTVPDVLSGGNHKAIHSWRREAALDITLQRRPDLLDTAQLTAADASHLHNQTRTRLGRNLSIALVHHPVVLEGHRAGTSSLTNLDIHDIARTCRTYGLAQFYVVMPMQDQLDILDGILRHWVQDTPRHSDRAEALRLVRPVRSIEEACAHMSTRTGTHPRMWASSAQWTTRRAMRKSERESAREPERKSEHAGVDNTTKPALHFEAARECLRTQPALLLLGTGHGLAPEALDMCHDVLRPLCFLSDYNHLSVRAAAAIMVDRILGDVY